MSIAYQLTLVGILFPNLTESVIWFFFFQESDLQKMMKDADPVNVKFSSSTNRWCKHTHKYQGFQLLSLC